MKILIIFTGGTIGSTLNNNNNIITLDRNKSYVLIENYKKIFGLNVEYDVIEPYMELSENNTGLTIKVLINCVKSNLNSNYDGIIITHGTDTLQYSAAALSYTIGNNSIPICIVSSNFPIENPKSNGLFNFHGAIKFIEKSYGKGVWVVYKNNNDVIKIHRGTRLLKSNAFSDNVTSIYNSYYGWFDDEFIFYKNKSFHEKCDEMNLLTTEHLKEDCTNILTIESYPGMIYPKIPKGIEYIIWHSYHSGTINTKSKKAIKFLKSLYKRNINIFITGVSDEMLYESTAFLNSLNTIPLVNISPISAYVKLWLSSGSQTDIAQNINLSLSGDVVATY